MAKTLTALEIVEAFKAKGLKPKTFNIHVNHGKCCALGAICERDGIDNDDVVRMQYVKETYGPDFTHGIMNGFDFNYGSSPLAAYNDDYLNGFAIGQEVRRLVF